MRQKVYFYFVISPTGRMYVGQSINYKKRFRQYRCLACKSQRRLYQSLKEHTPAEHLFFVFYEGKCDQREADAIEKEYIIKFGAHHSEGGLNTSWGGSPDNRPNPDFKKAVLAGAKKYQERLIASGKMEAYKEARRENARKYMVPVMQLSMEGEYLKTYESISLAARETGTKFSKIKEVLQFKQGRRSTNGFKWALI